MAGDADRVAGEIRVEQLGQVRACFAVVRQRQIEHLIEIAVIDVAAPVDRDQRAAHDTIEIGVEMGVLQQL